jgi:dipeptidyl aminopeptidase/acylaminoacyl peptidase
VDRGKGALVLKYSHSAFSFLIGCCAIVALAGSCAEREPKLIPTHILFGNATRSMPGISPDARKLAYLAPYNGVQNVWVRTIGFADDRAVTRDADRGIKNYFWAYDDTHILYTQDVKGNDTWRLYGVNVNTGEIRNFTPFDSISVGVVGYSKRFPHTVIIWMSKANEKVRDAYRLDLDTGKLAMLARNPGNVAVWVADNDFAIRGAMAYRPQGGYDLLVRNSEESPWTRIASWDFEEIGSSGVLRFTRDGGGLFCLDARGANTGRLVTISTADSSVRVIAGDPRYEIVQAFFQVDTYEMQAVAFAREHVEWSVLDSTLKEDFDAVARLNRGDFKFESSDASDSTWVVSFNKDDGPVSYYRYDRQTKHGTFLFDEIPELKSYTLARMEPISFKARDGLEIHGYITYPPGKRHRNLPLVVRVHGGPWIRDYWGYNPEVQWLANRGYACLQVNFRGSRGYGKDFLHAGNREFGGKMQDDVFDGVKWAIDRGIANPKKLAMLGSTYGGYAVLVALTATPDLFACGIDVSGPGDLITWVNALATSWGGAGPVVFKRIGDPRTDTDFLKSHSPLFLADRIKTPLFISQGAKDPFVPTADVERIIAALATSGTPHEYLLFQDEGPGIYRLQNKLKFWDAAERFLAKHLGGRYDESAER